MKSGKVFMYAQADFKSGGVVLQHPTPPPCVWACYQICCSNDAGTTGNLVLTVGDCHCASTTQIIAQVVQILNSDECKAARLRHTCIETALQRNLAFWRNSMQKYFI